MSIIASCNVEGVHGYPEQLVSFIFDLWETTLFQERLRLVGIVPDVQLPGREVLQKIISACYQASLLQEEARQVRFRLIIREPDMFPADEGPPTGLHRLRFCKSRPFNEYELHRMAPAADFYRTLIGVSLAGDGGVRIWGVINSGTRWLQTAYGGRKSFPPLPHCLVIYVTGPGRISVCIGYEMIASLNGGWINCPTLDVFSARWLTESYAEVRSEMQTLHGKARAEAAKQWAQLDPEFGGCIAQQVVRRIISVIRNSGHGGTLVFLPLETSRVILGENRFMSIKYQFGEEEPRQRLCLLMLRIMNTLAELYGEKPDMVVGWKEYVTCQSEALALLDEAIFDVAHFIAVLSATDGAVIMSKRQELLGYGAVISVDVDKVETVNHALDTEGNLTEPELSEGVGTRHRAAYRLCHELHDVIVVVISQDGNVRFVKWHHGAVTYSDYASTVVPGF